MDWWSWTTAESDTGCASAGNRVPLTSSERSGSGICCATETRPPTVDAGNGPSTTSDNAGSDSGSDRGSGLKRRLNQRRTLDIRTTLTTRFLLTIRRRRRKLNKRTDRTKHHSTSDLRIDRDLRLHSALRRDRDLRAASLLPGLLAATRTGLTPAGDNEHERTLDLHLRSPFFLAHLRMPIDRPSTRGCVLLPLTSPPPRGAGPRMASTLGGTQSEALSRRRSRQQR